MGPSQANRHRELHQDPRLAIPAALAGQHSGAASTHFPTSRRSAIAGYDWSAGDAPYAKCEPADERLRFVARLLEGEKMAPLCREFGLSRVTGYKIFDRYKACGLDGLHDRSKAPYRQANKLSFQVERAILGLTKAFPTRGAPKLRDKLIHDYPFDDRTIRMTRCGRICLASRKISPGVALAETLVGIREVDDQVWLVGCMEFDLGYFDRDQDRVEPGPNPFGPDTVLTMCPESDPSRAAGIHLLEMSARVGLERTRRGASYLEPSSASVGP